VKLPVPQEVLDQLASTDQRMGEIVEVLNVVSGQLAELIELQRAQE
jgi:hypothetical protein